MKLTRRAPADQSRKAAPGRTGQRKQVKRYSGLGRQQKVTPSLNRPCFSGIDDRKKTSMAQPFGCYAAGHAFCCSSVGLHGSYSCPDGHFPLVSHRPSSRCLLCARLRAPVRPRSRCTCRSLPAASYGRSFLAGCPGHSQAAREKALPPS